MAKQTKENTVEGQRELEIKTCKPPKARENAVGQVSFSFSLYLIG